MLLSSVLLWSRYCEDLVILPCHYKDDGFHEPFQGTVVCDKLIHMIFLKLSLDQACNLRGCSLLFDTEGLDLICRLLPWCSSLARSSLSQAGPSCHVEPVPSMCGVAPLVRMSNMFSSLGMWSHVETSVFCWISPTWRSAKVPKHNFP